LPAVNDPRLAEGYNSECSRLGFDGGFVLMPEGPAFIHISEDPEGDWRRIAPHALYDASTYASWQPPDQRSLVLVRGATEEDVRNSGVYRVLTPEGCIAFAKQGGHVVLHPLMGGLDPEFAWRSLKLFETRVLPYL